MVRHTQKRGNSKRNRSIRLLQKVTYQGNYDTPTSIEMIHYTKGQFAKKELQVGQALKPEIIDKSVYWFKVSGMSDADSITRICEEFGIQRFDIKDLFSNLHLTKIVSYPKTTFIMMSSCAMSKDNNVEIAQIAFILGNNFVISFEETPSPVFDDIITAISESRAQIREKGADYLLYILFNGVHTLYIDAIERIYDQVEEIEDRLIDNNETDRYVMSFFRSKRADYMLLRRSINPLREELSNLLHNSNDLLKDGSIIYFDDFDDRMRTALDELEVLNESINSLMDLYFNNNNLKMNEIVKRLTVISTIFIPLTFMVGVWGMNFKLMPELEWEYGYLTAWAILIVIAVIAIIFLKKRRWF